jgi:uncharacterized membrane protein YukC
MKVSLASLVFAMTAFALAFVTDYSSYLNAPAPKSLTEISIDAASGAAKSTASRVRDFFQDDETTKATAEVPKVDWKKRGIGISVLLAVTSILLASIAFVRQESDRAIVASLSLAGAALAYQFVLKGLIALTVGLLIASLLRTRKG